MKITETYEITESDIRYKDKDVVATIKITAGDFKDTIFHFGEINFAEEESAEEYAEFLAETLPLLLFETTRMQ